jgi:glycosyltransferase involved in cell wall biosynthesis
VSDERPLVSVMIGVYNAVRYVGEAIDSVLAQTYEPIELIVVDDGSDDGTRDVIARYGSALRLVSQRRGGIGAGRNRAVATASGDFFAFLDGDDRFVPDKIERQLEAFATDPSFDVVFGHVREFLSPDLDTAEAARIRAPVSDAPWPTPNLMLIRRDAFTRVGPFSTTLRVGVGVDWCARATEAGLTSFVLPHVVLERRLHAANNGLREADSRVHYAHVLKAALDRRRAALEGRADGMRQ